MGTKCCIQPYYLTRECHWISRIPIFLLLAGFAALGPSHKASTYKHKCLRLLAGARHSTRMNKSVVKRLLSAGQADKIQFLSSCNGANWIEAVNPEMAERINSSARRFALRLQLVRLVQWCQGAGATVAYRPPCVCRQLLRNLLQVWSTGVRWEMMTNCAARMLPQSK